MSSTTPTRTIATPTDADPIPSSGGDAERTRYPRGEGDRLRTDLLDAAADLMAEKGDIDAVSLRAIAGRVGVSPTAVYRHFDDHLSLLRAAVENCWAEFEVALESAADESDDPYDRLRRSGQAYVRFAMEQPGKYHVLFSNKIDVGREHNPVGESAFDHLVDKVAAILDANDDPRDARFVAVQVHTWIHGMVDLCGRHTDFDWPPTDLMLDELALRLGLTARPS